MSRNLGRDDLLVPATRYYMGRQTIGVTAHCQALAKAWPELSAGVRDTIRRDLEDVFRRDDQMRADPVCSPSYYPLGSDVDRLSWELVRAAYSGQETPADLVGALQDKVHADSGPFRVGRSVKETPSARPEHVAAHDCACAECVADEVRCTCKDFPGADEFCTAHKFQPCGAPLDADGVDKCERQKGHTGVCGLDPV